MKKSDSYAIINKHLIFIDIQDLVLKSSLKPITKIANLKLKETNSIEKW